ncbi:MAG TPA: hypothetical protein VM283_02315, partial [Armatimonadota bacterium]|nr:hypothetical protein [Armatimonadota bacterium]
SMWFTASRMRSGALRETKDVLSAGAPSAAALRRLLGALAAADPEGEFKRFMCAQSAVVADEFDQLLVSPEDCFASMGMSLSDLPSSALTFLRLRRYRAFRSMHNSEEELWLRWVREAYEASLTVPAAPIEEDEPARQGPLADVTPALPLTLQSCLGFHGSVYARMPCRRDDEMARLNVARAAIALALYRAEHGEYPESLSDLEAATGEALPTDPFTRGPLHYERGERGFIVYSVGENGYDDGGRTDDAGDIVWECTR